MAKDGGDTGLVRNIDETLAHIPRVLLIESSDDHAREMRAILKRLHFLVLRESSGRGALEKYGEFRPDLVMLELNLPDMTGWEVLDAMKEARSYAKRLAIIVVTEYNDPANRLMGRLQGVDEYLVKPCTEEDIERVVKDVFGKRGLLMRE
jgi:DNA-binding response OmpR family regulator